jgi:hypothetical protein
MCTYACYNTGTYWSSSVMFDLVNSYPVVLFPIRVHFCSLSVCLLFCFPLSFSTNMFYA